MSSRGLLRASGVLFPPAEDVLLPGNLRTLTRANQPKTDATLLPRLRKYCLALKHFLAELVNWSNTI